MKRIKENQSNQTSKLPNSNTLDTLSLANIFENTTYIEENYFTIRSWAYWEWLVYMQRKNPKVDDMSNKLFLPEERDFLCRNAEI